MIDLYDKQILAVTEAFKSLNPVESESLLEWPILPHDELILRSDMAFDLGSVQAAAISGILFTTSKNLISENKVFVCPNVLNNPSAYNPDSSINYAKFVLIKLKEKEIKDKSSQQLFGIFRNLDYVRYNVFPKGFSIRISSSLHKEVVRVSKEAISEAISLEAIGNTFIKAYLKIPQVEAVHIYFAAQQEASPAFNELKTLSLQAEQITESLNVIFSGLKMDCSTCGQKTICDQIDGMKNLHQNLK